jgi:hypothetical protein
MEQRWERRKCEDLKVRLSGTDETEELQAGGSSRMLRGR